MHWTHPGHGAPARFKTGQFGLFWPQASLLMVLLLALVPSGLAAADDGPQAVLTNKTGMVQYEPRDKRNWINETPEGMALYARDWIRTLEGSSAVVWIRNKNTSVRLRELSTLEVLPPEKNTPIVSLLNGALYFFSRERSQELEIRTPHGNGGPRGTEFMMSVDTNQTVLVMFDGVATLTNEFGQITLQSGEAGIAKNGQQPIKAQLETVNLVQWWLYYPGVVDVDELDLDSSEKSAYGNSITAYKKGDLAGALRAFPGYPSPAEPKSEGARIYLAALFLATGEVDKTEALLAKVRSDSSVATALRWLIAAVRRDVDKPPQVHTSASEWLGLSYYFQARHQLPEALHAAELSAAAAPDFALAWERVAELEFSFDRIPDAKKALTRSLRLAPLNAEAYVLQGFLLSAENRINAAHMEFDEAIGLTPNLGEAWLGRGLTRIRAGDTTGGRADLEMATVLEPNRSLFHSYLGKAFQDAGEDRNALLELSRARGLDTNDPTPYLYSALLDQQDNRVNEAINDLEKSQSLNNDRQVFRSSLLLDQDWAVGSANLANLYNDAGMTDVGVREAAKAVTEDYGNSSAHLFLADSYTELYDPTLVNQRYETARFNEYLLANLLSPVGGGRLAVNISQQEYSKLFESDGFGLASSTLVESDKSLTETLSQFSTFGNTSYALDLTYQNSEGVRANNSLDSIQWNTTIKQQLTPSDTVLALIMYQNVNNGDLEQYYNQSSTDENLRQDETEHPILLAGWHHEWAPGIDTLVLGGRLEAEQNWNDLGVLEGSVAQNGLGEDTHLYEVPMDVEYHNKMEFYTAAVNQIFQWDRVTISTGGAYQTGDFMASSLLFNPPPADAPYLNSPPANTSIQDDYKRLTGYGYLTVEPLQHLWLTGGLTYDEVTYPLNILSYPISPGDGRASQLGPKAALVWSPLSDLTIRGIYTKSLGGLSLDQDARLEPTELAGFPQTFKSLIPESVVGSVAGPKYQTYGLAFDLKFPTKTYASIEVQRLETGIHRDEGGFASIYGALPYQPASTPESLDYGENDLSASINQLLGKYCVAGASYTYSRARLGEDYPGIPLAVDPLVQETVDSTLHQIGGYAVLTLPSGFFARAELHWYDQINSGYVQAVPGDNFFQENIFAGWRFDHRRIQVTAGILNLADSDYHLSPVNIHPEWPHQRTFTLQLDFIY